MAEEQALQAGLRAVVAEVAKEEAPARLEAALLNAFREHAAAALPATVIPLPIKHRQPWGAAMIAAGIFILCSAAVFWQQASSLKQRSGGQAKAQAPTVAPKPWSPEIRQPAVDEKPAVHRRNSPAPRRTRHHTPTTTLPETEEVTDFFPLLEGDDLSSLESGQIVRIEVQGSSLLAVGLPVDVAMASESVKADVVLGPDGLARAIRFVR